MKTMRRLLATAGIAAILVSLPACGGSSTSSGKSDAPAKVARKPDRQLRESLKEMIEKAQTDGEIGEFKTEGHICMVQIKPKFKSIDPKYQKAVLGMAYEHVFEVPRHPQDEDLDPANIAKAVDESGEVYATYDSTGFKLVGQK